MAQPINFLGQLVQSGALNTFNPMEAYGNALKLKGMQTDIKSAELNNQGKALTMLSGYADRIKPDEMPQLKGWMKNIGFDENIINALPDNPTEEELAIIAQGASAYAKAQEGYIPTTIINPDGTVENKRIKTTELQNMQKGLGDNIVVGTYKTLQEAEIARKFANDARERLRNKSQTRSPLTDVDDYVERGMKVFDDKNPKATEAQRAEEGNRLALEFKRAQAEEQRGTARAKADVEVEKEEELIPIKEETAERVEAAKVVGKDIGETRAGLQQTLEQADETIKLVDELLAHPGFKMAVGASRLTQAHRLKFTDAGAWEVRRKQLLGKQFMEAYKTLKGGGQITEIEGEKATDAMSRMDAAQSEEEFIQAANDFKEVVRKGRDRALMKLGKTKDYSKLW